MANEDDFQKMDLALAEVYISKLPYSIIQQLCNSMDPDEGWSNLACVYGYTMQEILKFKMEMQRQNGSPTSQLLWDLCTRNITIGELHGKLMKCNRIRDMRILESATVSKPVQPTIGQSAHAVPDAQSENVNFFRPSTASMGSKKPQPLADKVKHYDDKIIPGQSKGNHDSNFSESSVPQENADESLHVPFGNLLVSSPKEKELIESLKKMTAQRSLDVAIAMIGTHYFTYEQLSKATNDFSAGNKLGEGAFGEVYLGTCLNTKCAIKRLFEKVEANDKAEGPSSLLASELTTLLRYRHENLVGLYGYALDGEEVCLVYQYMPNGSLEDRIQCKNGSAPLTWEQRISILQGAACGLQYLHTLESKPLIHGDMKSPNILLDKYFEAKIADLGRARHAEKGSTSQALTLITKKETKSKAYQSKAYLAPELKRGSRPSTKGDAFAFGVILFETCTGEKAYDDKREGGGLLLNEYLSEIMEVRPETSWTELQDNRVSNCGKDIFIRLLKLGSLCIKKKIVRPDMVEVFKKLEQVVKDMSRTTNEASEFSPSDKSHMTSTISSSNNVSTQESSTDTTNISFLSDGGYNPGIMTACPNPYSSQEKLNLDIPNQPQLHSPNEAKSPYEMLPPGYPIPQPIILQMMQDNVVLSGIVKHGDHWVKAACEYSNKYNDQNCIQSDPKKIAEMEKFDKETSETFLSCKQPMQTRQSPLSPELQSDPKKLEYIRQFDGCIMKKEMEKEKEKESVDNNCPYEPNTEEDQSLLRKQRRNTFFANYKLVMESTDDVNDKKDNAIETNKNNRISVEQCSVRPEGSTEIPDPSQTNKNNHISVDQCSVRPEGSTEIPDPSQTISDHAEVSFWHSNKEPTECEESISDDTFRECDEIECDSMSSDCLLNSGFLPVTDLLEDAESPCNTISETSQSWKNNIVNMDEMKGPPKTNVLSLNEVEFKA